MTEAIKRRLLRCCTAGIIGGMLVNTAPLAAQTWQYHTTARFVLAYAAAQKKLALQILADVQNEDRELAARLQFSPTRMITVYLCPTPNSFEAMTGGVIPHWGEAAADPTQWRIFLKAWRLLENKHVTLKHELAHLQLAELAYPRRVPRWFNEGAAMWLAQETQHVEPKLISRALATNSLLTFDDLEALLAFPNEKASLAYSESYHAVNFLTRRFGAAAIPTFARALARHSEARAAFQATFKEDLWDFEIAYFDDVRKNFRWYFLWEESMLWGLGFLLLFLAAYIATRLRTSKQAKEWEREEREANEEDEPSQDDDANEPSRERDQPKSE